MTATRTFSLTTLLGTTAALGLAFQVGHFIEHALQFGVWVLGTESGICGRDTPWMSPWVTPTVEAFGAWAWPAASFKLQMMRSMEVLHIVGNSIFLAALACLLFVIPNRWVKWAFGIELFHLYEHIMLTTTVFTIGKPVGLSTLFGGSSFFSQETAVGIRVSWHFFMNLFPMPFAMMGIMRWWEDRAEKSEPIEKGRVDEYLARLHGSYERAGQP